ncbi:MAG TPA: DUF1254 domain-containing protein [Polyangia bacterium]|nr:DUF1254 domain-containing protein [Polyangia bacterium]
MSESSETVASPAPTALTPHEAEAIATLGYIYGYPLVLMDVTRAAWPTPANRFAHAAEFPDDKFTDVVSPNVDTLYSTAWLDLNKEPIVLALPDVGRRYYTMQLLDAWTNVVAAPGTRTTGNGRGAFALIGPGWSGELPSTLEAIQSPTGIAWLIGRTYTAGRRDYDAVHAVQRQYRLVPLRTWLKTGDSAPPPAAAAMPMRSEGEPPVAQVDKLAAGAFFARLTRLMKTNLPATADEPLVRRLARLGIAPGEPFDLARLPASIADAIEGGVAAARARLHSAGQEAMGKVVDGWRMRVDLGRYGTGYELRAAIALMGLGANLPEDAVYPATDVDSAGQPLSGEHRYRLRFGPGALPPVKAFWSLTIYNDKHFLVANPIGRYALGDRDPIRAEPDGTLEVFIQHDDPGPDKRSNWLPAPADRFTLGLRLYFPKPSVLDGSWRPPPVTRV